MLADYRHRTTAKFWICLITGLIADGTEDELENVLTVQMPRGQAEFVLGPDGENAMEACAFWAKIGGEVGVATKKSAGRKYNDDLQDRESQIVAMYKGRIPSLRGFGKQSDGQNPIGRQTILDWCRV